MKTREEEKEEIRQFVKERFWYWFHHQMKKAVEGRWDSHYNVCIGMDVTAIVPTSWVTSDMRAKYGDQYMRRIKENLWNHGFYAHVILAEATGGEFSKSKKVRDQFKRELKKYGFTMRWRRSGLWQGWQLYEIKETQE